MQLLILASADTVQRATLRGHFLAKAGQQRSASATTFRPTVCAASATPFRPLSARRRPSRRPRAVATCSAFLEGGDALPAFPQPAAELARDVLVEQEVRLPDPFCRACTNPGLSSSYRTSPSRPCMKNGLRSISISEVTPKKSPGRIMRRRAATRRDNGAS